MNPLIHTYQSMMANQYIFETEDYAHAINQLTQLYTEPDSIAMLSEMAQSQHFSHTFALAYILESTPQHFLLKHKQEIMPILKQAISKKYFRANFYLAEVLVPLLADSSDYTLFLSMIYAEHETEHNQAICQLLKLEKQDFMQLNQLSDYDFSIFYTTPLISPSWFVRQTECRDYRYQKIALTAAYRQCWDKQRVFALTNKRNPNLFDFVFFLPDKPLYPIQHQQAA